MTVEQYGLICRWQLGKSVGVCNEESKINGMRPNRSVKNDDGAMVDFIFGPAFICDCRGENLVDYFRSPEAEPVLARICNAGNVVHY